MSRMVLGVGTSHSPLLVAAPDRWMERAVQDRSNPELYDATGTHRTYDELEAAADPRLRAQVRPEVWSERFQACQEAISRLAHELADAAPDLVVVIGDDQQELFGFANMPAVAVYWGDHLDTAVRDDLPETPFWAQVREGYAADARHRYAAAPAEAEAIIGGLIDRGFDVAACREPTGKGFGHAYGFVVRQLLRERPVPVLPVMLNTYFPPNQPTPARCHDLGAALRHAVEALPGDRRVAVVASGGLSHFVVDEELDRGVIAALQRHDASVLRSLPVARLKSGSSEIRNWVTLAGAVTDLDVRWLQYTPCYRSAAGTGCGMAFGSWA